MLGWALHTRPKAERRAGLAKEYDTAATDLLAKLDGRHPRFIHIDGEHSRTALTRDLDLLREIARANVLAATEIIDAG